MHITTTAEAAWLRAHRPAWADTEPISADQLEQAAHDVAGSVTPLDIADIVAEAAPVLLPLLRQCDPRVGPAMQAVFDDYCRAIADRLLGVPHTSDPIAAAARAISEVRHAD